MCGKEYRKHAENLIMPVFEQLPHKVQQQLPCSITASSPEEQLEPGGSRRSIPRVSPYQLPEPRQRETWSPVAILEAVELPRREASLPLK